MWSIMAIPGALLFLILQIFLGSTSGTSVTRCDSCHDEATCLQSQDRGNSLNHTFSCVCKDGFVGDGLTCYDKKFCSNSSCCSQGYHWSSDGGCVDTDECSLPDSPCEPSQVCQNIPGSFECLTPSFRYRSSPSSQSVQVSCGKVVCPPGLGCISDNGNLRCADPCEHYTVLNDEWRSIDNTPTKISHCDRNVNWQGWYRMFLGQSSAHIPETCVDINRCGTNAPLWITEPHPTQSDEIVERTVCNTWDGSCCRFPSHIIHVKLCHGGYYVYRLAKPSVCNLAYCAVPHSQLWVYQLICDRDKLQVGVNAASLTSSGLDPFSGNLAASNCTWVREQDNVVWYEVDATEGACGNTLRANRTHAIYSNSLFIYPSSNESFRLPVSLPFSCAYPLNTDTSLNMAVRPFLELEGGISGSGTRARASMSLFRDSNYTETYSAGRVTLPVGSPLYVGVSVAEKDPSFAVVLEDCYATHSSNPDDPMKHFFIQNKCPSDRRQVSVTESGSSLQARFTALFFLLQDEYRDVFLHCSLSLCDQRTSSCVPPCTRRMRRSVSSSEPVKPLTIGPIIWEK